MAVYRYSQEQSAELRIPRLSEFRAFVAVRNTKKEDPSSDRTQA